MQLFESFISYWSQIWFPLLAFASELVLLLGPRDIYFVFEHSYIFGHCCVITDRYVLACTDCSFSDQKSSGFQISYQFQNILLKLPWAKKGTLFHALFHCAYKHLILTYFNIQFFFSRQVGISSRVGRKFSLTSDTSDEVLISSPVFPNC